MPNNSSHCGNGSFHSKLKLGFKKVIYEERTHRVMSEECLGRNDMYKLASNYSGGAPFCAKIENCETIEQ
jgi:hypothetical protein